MAYIGKIQIDDNSVQPIGSTLYGVCNSAADEPAKVVTLADFNYYLTGITIHVKFVNGNTVTPSANFTLNVGGMGARVISNPGGSCMWSENAVVSFTYDGTEWIANDGTFAQVTIDNSYSSSSTNAISGQGVAAALGTLGDAAQKDVITEIDNTNKTSTDLPTTAAVTQYVDNKTSGLTGAMHFAGVTTTEMSDGRITAVVTINNENYTPTAGDVVLSNDEKEYVWTGTAWELLGAEGSYALKSSQVNVIKEITWDAGTLPSFTATDVTIPRVTDVGELPSLLTKSTSLDILSVSQEGEPTSAEVTQGVLKITTGSATTLATSSVTINEVDDWDEGSLPTLGASLTASLITDKVDGSLPTLTTETQTVIKP